MTYLSSLCGQGLRLHNVTTPYLPGGVASGVYYAKTSTIRDGKFKT